MSKTPGSTLETDGTPVPSLLGEDFHSPSETNNKPAPSSTTQTHDSRAAAEEMRLALPHSAPTPATAGSHTASVLHTDSKHIPPNQVVQGQSALFASEHQPTRSQEPQVMAAHQQHAPLSNESALNQDQRAARLERGRAPLDAHNSGMSNQSPPSFVQLEKEYIALSKQHEKVHSGWQGLTHWWTKGSKEQEAAVDARYEAVKAQYEAMRRNHSAENKAELSKLAKLMSDANKTSAELQTMKSQSATSLGNWGAVAAGVGGALVLGGMAIASAPITVPVLAVTALCVGGAALAARIGSRTSIEGRNTKGKEVAIDALQSVKEGGLFFAFGGIFGAVSEFLGPAASVGGRLLHAGIAGAAAGGGTGLLGAALTPSTWHQGKNINEDLAKGGETVARETAAGALFGGLFAPLAEGGGMALARIPGVSNLIVALRGFGKNAAQAAEETASGVQSAARSAQTAGQSGTNAQSGEQLALRAPQSPNSPSPGSTSPAGSPSGASASAEASSAPAASSTPSQTPRPVTGAEPSSAPPSRGEQIYQRVARTGELDFAELSRSGLTTEEQIAIARIESSGEHLTPENIEAALAKTQRPAPEAPRPTARAEEPKPTTSTEDLASDEGNDWLDNLQSWRPEPSSPRPGPWEGGGGGTATLNAKPQTSPMSSRAGVAFAEAPAKPQLDITSLDIENLLADLPPSARAMQAMEEMTAARPTPQFEVAPAPEVKPLEPSPAAAPQIAEVEVKPLQRGFVSTENSSAPVDAVATEAQSKPLTEERVEAKGKEDTKPEEATDPDPAPEPQEEPYKAYEPQVATEVDLNPNFDFAGSGNQPENRVIEVLPGHEEKLHLANQSPHEELRQHQGRRVLIRVGTPVAVGKKPDEASLADGTIEDGTEMAGVAQVAVFRQN